MLVRSPGGRSAWLPLWRQNAILYFPEIWFAPAWTVINHGPVMLISGDSSQKVIDDHAELIDLLRDSFDFAPSDEGIAGLKADMENSIHNDVQARRQRAAWNGRIEHGMRAAGVSNLPDYLRSRHSPRGAAIFLDQWGALEGHPYYPTWKARPGLPSEEVSRLSPEFDAQVQVRIAALRADMAYVEHVLQVASYRDWFAAHFPELWQDWQTGLEARGVVEADWLPLPIHGWHLEAFVRGTYAAEIEEGVLILDGPDLLTRPSMSFRTMMPGEPADAPFIKLPVAVWMTSEQRSLQAKSIQMGPRISAVISAILEAESGFDNMLDIFPEEVGLYYKHATRQDDAPGRHLSVVYRSTQAAFSLPDGSLPVTVATLFTGLPGTGRPFITSLIEGDGSRASQAAVEAFFRDYVRVVTRPVVAIYLLYGIALEAHQQNTTVVFEAGNKPAGLLIRDFGDGRTFAPWLNERGYALKPYVYQGILPTVFSGDVEPVRMFVLDAAFVSHLHEVALVLSDEYGFQGPRLWEVLREETEAAFDVVKERVEPGRWEQEREAFLEEPWPTRSLLRMHMQKYSDYRVQHGLKNPLAKIPS
ncbi:IucA/IucC family siderophore biosynthesis protein [Bosea sp. Tri-44]|nr:IucA/IucC family siderophore biosynthesis protein [Bosea sp. Tri-44]